MPEPGMTSPPPIAAVPRITVPRNVIAGFTVNAPVAALPHLRTVGEQWLASRADIAWHEHPVWECYVQLAGTATWEDRRGRIELGPGAGYLVAPGTWHRLARVRDPRHHFAFAILDLDGLVRDRLPHLAPALAEARRLVGFQVAPAERIRDPLRALCSAIRSGGSLRDQAVGLAQDALAVALLQWVVEPAAPPALVEHPAVHLVRSRIESAPGRPWSLAQLAEGSGLGPKHLCALFGAKVGETPHRYLLSVRLACAKRALLESDLSVTEIAAELGFASSQHFARTFRARVGTTPRDFRRRPAA
jgi:AraC-like DNA-binding protein